MTLVTAAVVAAPRHRYPAAVHAPASPAPLWWLLPGELANDLRLAWRWLTDGVKRRRIGRRSG